MLCRTPGTVTPSHQGTSLYLPRTHSDTRKIPTHPVTISTILRDHSQTMPENEGGTVNTYIYHRRSSIYVFMPSDFWYLCYSREDTVLFTTWLNHRSICGPFSYIDLYWALPPIFFQPWPPINFLTSTWVRASKRKLRSTLRDSS